MSARVIDKQFFHLRHGFLCARCSQAPNKPKPLGVIIYTLFFYLGREHAQPREERAAEEPRQEVGGEGFHLCCVEELS